MASIQAKTRRSRLGVKGHGVRSCAVRLWARGQCRARATARRAGEDHRSDLGREREATRISRPTTLRRRFRTCGPGKRRWRVSIPRPMNKNRRSPQRRQPRTRSRQARMQMAFALTAPISYPLVLIVVGWVVCLFCGFGLMSRGYPHLGDRARRRLDRGRERRPPDPRAIHSLFRACFALRLRHWSRRWRSWGRSRGGAHSILPGFITPFGSSVALIWRISASEAGSFHRASSPRLS